MRLIGLVLSLSITLVPLAAEAQQPFKVPKIGLLTAASPAGAAVNVQAFLQGMQELGHIEGKTFVLETRYTEGRAERLPELARELVALQVDVIVASTDAPIAAVKRETRAIPIVMANSTDPVGTGFVAALAHPGGNVTGLSNVSADLSGKGLELLREIVPGLSRVVASSLHLELQSVEVSSAADLDRAFSAVRTEHPQAILVAPSNPVAFSKRVEIASFTQRSRLPSMYGLKEYVDAGGLMSYGPSLPALYRRAATYVDKILKGARPDDLPVERPTKFELVINLRTAKALRLTIPQTLLQRADELIQ